MTGLASTSVTRNVAFSKAAPKALASSPEPTSSRVIFLPSAPTSLAVKAAPAAVGPAELEKILFEILEIAESELRDPLRVKSKNKRIEKRLDQISR